MGKEMYPGYDLLGRTAADNLTGRNITNTEKYHENTIKV